MRQSSPVHGHSAPGSDFPASTHRPSTLTRGSVVALSLSLLYLVLLHCTIGIRPEHVVLVLVYDIGLVAHPASAKLMRALTIFLIYGVLYDGMKIAPNDSFGFVDIEGLYRLEKSLFGIGTQGVVLTPNEYFAQHHTPLLDIVTGLFYVNWISVPLGFAVYLFAVNRRRYLDYALVFLLVNILGFIAYYVHPAAPPWYVAQHGFAYIQGTQGSAAELVRFDRLLGLEIFQSIYTRNSNVFAAVPSLHAAYPVVVLFYAARQLKRKYRAMYYAVFMIGIWFAAVYSGHHYVIDVLLGVIWAVAGIVLYEHGLMRNGAFRRFLERYARRIA
jgi:hypothetical protein